MIAPRRACPHCRGPLAWSVSDYREHVECARCGEVGSWLVLLGDVVIAEAAVYSDALFRVGKTWTPSPRGPRL
jgi:hypothetical protein